jgi:DNA helicase-2/ATP-dependent DNA helicase PcrA
MNAIAYQARLGLPYLPSDFQCAIWEWVQTGRGHGVIEAVAGGSKSSVIIAAAKLIASDGLFVAFNKTIADMLAKFLVGTSMVAKTVHGHGFACVRDNARCSLRIEAAKYRNMVDGACEAAVERGELCRRPLTPEQNKAILEEGFPSKTIEKLIDLARLDLLDLDGDGFDAALLELAERHDLLDFDECLESVVCSVVRRCMQMGADTHGEIDFTDMVWLPVVNRWRPRQYSWVFVDECQDISKAALALVQKSIRRGGRTLFVGDRKQAIYAWCGADSNAMQRIIEEMEATVLPLSVCYRCPTSVLDTVRDLCPQIQARPGAPVGIVRDATRDEFAESAREGDLVLCRRNAPLLGLCFELIASGIPAVVRGRNIGEGLVKIVDKVCKKRFDFARFGEGLDAWLAKQTASATARSKDVDKLAQKIDTLNDQAEALRIIAERSEAATAASLRTAITDLFSDERGAVTLSSIHRAKGLEAERVAILEPERLGWSRHARTPEQAQQERNLFYVAYTRAMSELILIKSDANPVAVAA